MNILRLSNIAVTGNGVIPTRELLFRLEARLAKDREEVTPLNVGHKHVSAGESGLSGKAMADARGEV